MSWLDDSEARGDEAAYIFSVTTVSRGNSTVGPESEAG